MINFIIPIILLIQVAFMVASIYLLVRNRKTARFLIEVNELCYEWSKRHISDIADKKEISAYDWFYEQKVRSYNYYLFSFRPLRLEEWFEKPDIEKLLDHNSDEKNNIS